MRSVNARGNKKCKHGHDIWSGALYYPQRRNKFLCFECGRKKSVVIAPPNFSALMNAGYF